ncbi:hypothetical protein BAY61_31970 (plasmid) [Prauserella marina]|uniref:Uncharacterized protein n=1 Tax=Prauserella marina TaxID=530584 RepID=A0A222W1G9_9PSEU|nr:hypothetical protein [Prauserella marina]ASR39902.1 hypothetical protein BAY61_31970 [Prauserella marina]PWV71401.1 hypothetical protein DES30_112117 [Prauserella marina]SDD98469.1 hypothetical protein SAMN05421630_115162 [Prauserella marina]
MTIQFLTFVVQTSRVGFDYDVPTLVVYTDVADEIDHLPLVEQLLQEDDTTVTPIARGYSPLAQHRHDDIPDHRLAPVPVSAEWLHVMREQYDHRAKIMMVRDPIPANTNTEPSTMATGAAPGITLPAWLNILFPPTDTRIAGRDVPVQNDILMTIATQPRAFTSVEEWANPS